MFHVKQEETWPLNEGPKYGTKLTAHRKQIAACFTDNAGHAFSSERHSLPPPRGVITSWSRSMGRRLRFTIDNFKTDFTAFVTLTYPASAPKTGAEVKAHWRALVERARRARLMESQSWVWWLEFQERGAPHLHFLSSGWIPKQWIAQNWADVTGGDSRVATRVEGLKTAAAAGAYAAKYASKQEQKQVPPDFHDVGRFWGMVGEARKSGELAGPACPSLTAVRVGERPGRTFRAISENFDARMYETPRGYVCYAPERTIKEIWTWLSQKK